MQVLQHHSVHALDISTIIVFAYLGLQFKWNQLSTKTYCHTSCIHKGLHAGKWPDQMISKPDYVSTQRYHWRTTLEPHLQMLSPSGLQVAQSRNHHLHNCNTLEDHWSHKYTGMPLEPLMLTPSGNPVLICICITNTLEDLWKTKGSTSETHWLPTSLSPVAYDGV